MGPRTILILPKITVLFATLLAVTHDHELLGRFDRVVDFSEYGTS